MTLDRDSVKFGRLLTERTSIEQIFAILDAYMRKEEAVAQRPSVRQVFESATMLTRHYDIAFDPIERYILHFDRVRSRFPTGQSLETTCGVAWIAFTAALFADYWSGPTHAVWVRSHAVLLFAVDMLGAEFADALVPFLIWERWVLDEQPSLAQELATAKTILERVRVELYAKLGNGHLLERSRATSGSEAGDQHLTGVCAHELVNLPDWRLAVDKWVIDTGL